MTVGAGVDDGQKLIKRTVDTGRAAGLLEGAWKGLVARVQQRPRGFPRQEGGAVARCRVLLQSCLFGEGWPL